MSYIDEREVAVREDYTLEGKIMDQEIVTLRTGVEIPKVVVNVILLSLQLLLETCAITLYELVMLARVTHLIDYREHWCGA